MGSGEPQLSFWGSPGHHQAGGRWRSARSLPTAQVRQALSGKGRKNPYPFLKGFGGLKRRVRARKDRPGLGKPGWWGEIPARAFSTRATFYLNTLPSPGYPYIPLSQSIAPPKADATQSPNCTPVPVSPSAARQNTPTQRGTEPPPSPYHTHDPTSSTTTSSRRAAPARQRPTVASTFPRRRSSARRWGSVRMGARGSVANASRSRSLRR